jgi:hypothetical protein
MMHIRHLAKGHPMIISIQFHLDRKPLTVELRPIPDAERPPYFLDDKTLWYWGSNGIGNEAALIFALQVLHDRAMLTAREVERERNQCEWFPWQCPHGALHLCLRRAYRRNQVLLRDSYFERYQQPIVQLSLFDPATHRPVWRHIRTGEIVDQVERPFETLRVVCEEMAVAALEWMKNREGLTPAAWRLEPADGRRKRWGREMAEQYAGRVPACVFDEWGTF